MDEPFSSLDPSTRKQLYIELKKIHECFSCTIIFVTHDFMEAGYLADRVGILLDGSLKAVVPADRLMEEHYSEEVEQFLGRNQRI